MIFEIGGNRGSAHTIDLRLTTD